MELDDIKSLAFKIHNDSGCFYGNGSYSVHLEMVNEFFIKYQKYVEKEAQIVQRAIWFHDIKEDCGKSMHYIQCILGIEAANIVSLVSNENGSNRKEKMLLTLPKIASSYNSIFVKLCDRLANTKYSLSEKQTTLKGGMYNMYCAEYPIFRYFLKKNSWFDDMWEELDSLSNFTDHSKISALQHDISTLTARRDSIYTAWDNTYDKTNDTYAYIEPVDIDILGDKIYHQLVVNCNILPVEFILETLTHLGSAPNLLYDDNGHFAVTCDGYQSVSSDSEAIDSSIGVHIESTQWKNSIRDAIVYFLTNEN